MRLIDADEFKGISWNSMSEMQEYTAGFDDGACYVLSKIDDAPTVDAVPVVRCKDCRHYIAATGEYWCNKNTTGNPYCDWEISPEWFCADGERGEAEPWRS